MPPVRIHIQNFQSIRQADLEVEGLTVVTGTNNAGKTASQRAISGVFQNTGGTAFIRHGTEKCSVEINFGDHTVLWEKGRKSRPMYIVDGGTPLYPGQGVPEEVLDLGVRPIKIGDQEIWPSIASQFTGQVFLIDKSGSVMAEALADVERVGQLNQALRSAESDRRQVSSELKVRQADLARQEAEIARFDGLDEAVALIDVLEANRKKVETLNRAIDGVTILRQRLTKTKQDTEFLSKVADVSVPEDNISPILEGLGVLRILNRRYTACQAQVRLYGGFIEIDLPSDEKLKKLLDAMDLLYGLRSRMKAAALLVANCDSELGGAHQELQEAEVEAKESLTELGQCPTCGTHVGRLECSP